MSQDTIPDAAVKPPMDVEGWGRALLEEVLVRAGLDTLPGDGVTSANATIAFTITANASDHSLDVGFDRVGASPVHLKVNLDDPA